MQFWQTTADRDSWTNSQQSKARAQYCARSSCAFDRCVTTVAVSVTIYLAFFIFTGLHPLKSASADDIHTVCGVLKKMLNELSEPLLPNGEKLAHDLTRDQGTVNEMS